MRFLEKDLEEIIFNSDKQRLEDRGLYLRGRLFRQLRIGNYGIADLVEVMPPYYHTYFKRHMKGEINIIELKKDNISVSSFFQALGYLKGIKRYLELKNDDRPLLFNYKITLIGSSFESNSSICYLGELLFHDLCEVDVDELSRTSVDLFTYDYTINGLEFKEVSGYRLTNENL